MKQISKFNRFLSGVLSMVMVMSAIPAVSVHAEEKTSAEPYPYTMFAASNEEGAITVNANNFSVNGNVATNGTIVSSGNMNINGTKTESAEESMIFIFDKIDNQYFSTSSVDKYKEDYTLDEMNINVNVPTEVQGEATLTGNININNALKALEDITLYGEVKNSNDSVIFSQYGDIIIDSQNVNLNGLVYAPFGSVNITAQNLNLNNTVIIADTITFNCPSVNANYSNNAGTFVGINSEDCPIIAVDKTNMVFDSAYNAYYITNDFQQLNGFLGKSDEMLSFNVKIYDLVDTLIYSSSITPELKWKIDDIGLMCGVNKIVLTAQEANGNIYTNEITLVVDSSKFVSNMQVDLNDDDGDGLWNYLETYFGTNPKNVDTDGDGLSDYIEIYTLGYNPLSNDTDADGVSDGDEDEDGDGLTNVVEVSEFCSNPIFSDTDHDGLKDNEEFEFGTSPIMKDTDEDGISDYDEYYLFNTDPLLTNPSEMQYTKTYTVDDIDGSYDKGVYPTVTLTGDSDCIKNFHMSSLERTPNINMSMIGYIGSAYCFETSGDMEKAVLTFTYDTSLLFIDDLSKENFQPTIYNYDEVTGDLIEVENQVWENNQVTAELEHFSIYLLLNKKEVELYWDSPWIFPETTVVKKTPTKQIAFLLDRSGSMDSNDPNYVRAKLVKEFASQLCSKDYVKIYSFDNSVNDYTKSGFIHYEDNISEAIDAFISNGNYGGTYIASALSSVYSDLLNEKEQFELIKELSADTESSLEQYIFLLTDGDSFDTPSADFLESLNESGICVYTVGLGSVNSNYLRSIADATGGKYYYASTSVDLEDIYLEFGKDIETNDVNKDGLDDYYEYMMCQGILKTRTGTTVFADVDYNTLMSNSDYDEDLLKNGEEIEIKYYGEKPYVVIHSDPTIKNSDHDIYSDYEEFNNGTNPLRQSYVINVEEFNELYNKGSYVYAAQADKYLSKSDLSLAFSYFVDVVFCGSESYFDVLASAVGGENLLVKEDKRLLVEYLSNLLDMSTEKSQEDGAIDMALSVVDGGYDFLDSLDSLVGDKVSSKILANETKEAIDDARKEISELQSEIDLGRNAGTINRKTYNERMSEISSKQSDLDRGRFAQEFEAEFNEHKEKYQKRYEDFGNVLEFVEFGYARIESINKLIDYSNQLAKFGQFKVLLEELSYTDFDYVAEAASSILSEIEKQEDGTYSYTAVSQFFYEAIGDAVEYGIDEVLDALGGNANAVFNISKLLVGTFLGNNLSLNRKNLLNADFTTTLVIMTLDDIKNICGNTKMSKFGTSFYICESESDCNSIKDSMIYAISARKFGEDKYNELCSDRSGIIGWLFNYNPLDHSDKTMKKVEDNISMLNAMLIKYNCYIKV